MGLQRQSLLRPKRAKPYRRQRATCTPILIHPRAGAPAPIPISCDVSVGHGSGTVLRIPLSWRLSGPRRLRAHPSRVKGASRRFAMAFGHPLTREPLRALMAGERAGQRPARRIRAAQTEGLERARIRPTETSQDPNTLRRVGLVGSTPSSGALKPEPQTEDDGLDGLDSLRRSMDRKNRQRATELPGAPTGTYSSR